MAKKKLVVFDSFFGNTEKIARAIGDAAGSSDQSRVVRVSDVKPTDLNGIELLFVGSPTRAFRPTKAISRFLKAIPAKSLAGISVAAFDTRMNVAEVNSRILNVMAKLFGYAAEPIARKLVQKGGKQAFPPQGFFVQGSNGPLKDGELARADAWASGAGN
jgi:flavodoxin